MTTIAPTKPNTPVKPSKPKMPAAHHVAQTRPYGLHPLAWQAYLQAGLPAWRIGQTIGHAAASAGTHAKDGEYQGHDYAACTDLRIRDLTDEEALALLPRLAAVGFAPFFRKPGHDHWPADQVRHIHMVWPDADAIKPMVLHQLRDWLAVPTRNGLASHVEYHAWQPDHDLRAVVRALFEKHYTV